MFGKTQSIRHMELPRAVERKQIKCTIGDIMRTTELQYNSDKKTLGGEYSGEVHVGG